MLLGVNIDHIAVLREARQINDPNPLDALGICKRAGADQITIHLREDRRHIVDADARNIINLSTIPVNLECSINDEIIDIVCDLNPHRVTLVPENRAEVTTEGGLDLEGNFTQIQRVINRLHNQGIAVSLFIDPSTKMIELSAKMEVEWIEIHTGKFANIYAMLNSGLEKTHHSIKELELPRAQLSKMLVQSVDEINSASQLASKTYDIKVAAGHGLNYQNVKYITQINEIIELNIGQSIIARSVFTGLENAIVEMKDLIVE
jgi:pyridoxine 5-phosphate synthase